MKYISVKEAASIWGISERRVRALCESGRIEGVTRCGDWVWSIPEGTQRPADGRTLRYIKNRNLRTGTQDYKQIDKLRRSLRITTITENQKTQIIIDAFAFEGKELSNQQVNDILSLKNQNIDLATQIMVLNMKSALDMSAEDINESTICSINKRLLLSIDEKNGGKYRTDSSASEESEALIGQYAGPWSVLHPVARATFLFSELLRIKPFEKATIQTAFVILAKEMVKAKLPPALFADTIHELKASLAQAQLRGNTQELLSLIIAQSTK